MARRSFTSTLTRAYQRNLRALSKATVKNAKSVATQTSKRIVRAAAKAVKPPAGRGDWIGGVAVGPAGVRRYHVFRPEGLDLAVGEPPPMLVMLHGCNQNSQDFAVSTQMNRLAARERFIVLYPEQDRVSHPNGCWRWYDVDSGRAAAEAMTIMAMIDQVGLLYRADLRRVAVAGLSAGAAMAGYLATRFPLRFQAVAMHSGVAPGAATSSKAVVGAMRGLTAPALPAISGALLPPLMVIHGGRDIVVSARSGAAAAEVWAAAAGARPVAIREVRRGARHAARVIDYKRAGRTMVTFSEIGDLGHAWSGGAAKVPFSDPQGPDASRMIWAFAMKQFRHVS